MSPPPPVTPENLHERLVHVSLSRLAPLLSEEPLRFIGELLRETKCLVIPVRARRTKHGDHRQSRTGEYSEVTVNVSGNPYQFLITLIHEIAHAKAFQTHGTRISAHGSEWRQTFAKMLLRALAHPVFPPDLAQVLQRQATWPDASSSRDAALQLALRAYDTKDLRPLVAELADGTWFSLDGKLILKRGAKLRTRFHCESKHGQLYRVPATARVHTIFQPSEP